MRKLKYPSKYYAQAFINNYENYYKNGGRLSNTFSDQVYKQLTGQEFEKKLKPLKPRKTQKKDKGKR